MLEIYRKFFRFAGSQKAGWYKGLVFEFLRSLFEGVQFLALFAVMQGLADKTASADTALKVLLIMLVSIAGMTVFWNLGHRCEGQANYRMCQDKRLKIGNRMKYMPMGYFSSQSLGSLTAAATSTMEDLESMSFAVIARTIIALIRTAIFVIILLVIDWRPAFIFIISFILFLFINSRLLKMSRKYSPKRLEVQIKLVDAALEYIQGMSIVRAFSGSAATARNLNETLEQTEQQNFRLESKRIPYIILEQAVLRIGVAVAASLSVYLFISGTMSLMICLMMLVSAFLVFSELETAGEMFFMLPMIDASITKVENIDDTPVIDIDGQKIQPESTDITVSDVTFSYGNRRIIDNVSFTIPQGTTTAIVGPSGGGKTTLCNLIARFWDVDGGCIMIGGRDVREYTLDSLMSNISMVFQKVYLFNDTITNNIKFGKPDATLEEVIAVSKKACCHEFIMALPDGYDTVIGEGGATISGGEKQRISIARAMLKDAAIIILDEATANVDPENENQLQKAIDALTYEKTIIMIAHRLKTVQQADQILVVDQGRIIQQGKHSELISQPGLYADFIEIRKKAVNWKL